MSKNTPLRDEALKHFDNGETQEEIVDDILNLLASKMPEKKTKGHDWNINSKGYDNTFDTGYNLAITEVKSILKGGTE